MSLKGSLICRYHSQTGFLFCLGCRLDKTNQAQMWGFLFINFPLRFCFSSLHYVFCNFNDPSFHLKRDIWDCVLCYMPLSIAIGDAHAGAAIGWLVIVCGKQQSSNHRSSNWIVFWSWKRWHAGSQTYALWPAPLKEELVHICRRDLFACGKLDAHQEIHDLFPRSFGFSWVPDISLPQVHVLLHR